MKFRKKPVVVEAVQFDGSMKSAEWFTWEYARNVWPEFEESEAFPGYAKWTGRLCVETLEGIIYASPGDWIITGINGERYPCKPDIFEATYEAVEN
jgi:hypothetical protein